MNPPDCRRRSGAVIPHGEAGVASCTWYGNQSLYWPDAPMRWPHARHSTATPVWGRCVECVHQGSPALGADRGICAFTARGASGTGRSVHERYLPEPVPVNFDRVGSPYPKIHSRLAAQWGTPNSHHTGHKVGAGKGTTILPADLQARSEMLCSPLPSGEGLRVRVRCVADLQAQSETTFALSPTLRGGLKHQPDRAISMCSMARCYGPSPALFAR